MVKRRKAVNGCTKETHLFDIATDADRMNKHCRCGKKRSNFPARWGMKLDSVVEMHTSQVMDVVDVSAKG